MGMSNHLFYRPSTEHLSDWSNDPAISARVYGFEQCRRSLALEMPRLVPPPAGRSGARGYRAPIWMQRGAQQTYKVQRLAAHLRKPAGRVKLNFCRCD